jgi:uncharacterized membrane protein YhhN
MIIPSLLIYYLVAVNKVNFWFVFALFFSFLGDAFLLNKKQFFVFGLASFLLTHFIYIKILIGFINKISIKKVLGISLPFLVFLVGFITFFYDYLNEMKLPVFIYASIISVFGAVAFLNYAQKKSSINLWLFLGAMLFILSDSIIALNTFYESKEMYRFCIMTTYIVAQFLISKAMIMKSFYQE